jgi:cytochrome c oxidase cbb3-type subunit 2
MPDAYRAALIYALGISAYSVLLVAVPSLFTADEDASSRARRAAWLFGIGGWIGSALGVGMAQQMHWLPGWFVLAAGGILLVAWILLRAPRYWAAIPVFGRTAGLLGLCAVGLHTADSRVRTETSLDAAARGREVYREEGCINCHSQYLRPRGPDPVNWGPYRPIDRTEMPPFVGNRRQGPDLKNAGLRRSPAWLRVHLRDPRRVVPGSRMPSYAHRFDGPESGGEDLVAYLSSLGRGNEAAFLDNIRQWRPAGLAQGSPARGQVQFGRHCAACHGAGGAGDGPAASSFDPPPRNLSAGPFAAADLANPDDPLAQTLARAIKYGLPGTSMPGHELLPDADIADLVRFVAGLQKANLEPREP